MGKPPTAIKKTEKPQKAPISKIWVCKSTHNCPPRQFDT